MRKHPVCRYYFLCFTSLRAQMLQTIPFFCPGVYLHHCPGASMHQSRRRFRILGFFEFGGVPGVFTHSLCPRGARGRFKRTPHSSPASTGSAFPCVGFFSAHYLFNYTSGVAPKPCSGRFQRSKRHSKFPGFHCCKSKSIMPLEVWELSE